MYACMKILFGPHVDHPQGRKSVFDIVGWFGGASAPIARLRAQGVSEGDVPPWEAENFCIFATGIVQFGEYFRGKFRVGDEWKQFFGPDWPKFCILGDIFHTIVLELLKISCF